MSAEKRTISADSELFEKAEKRIKELKERGVNYPDFSKYIQALMRADAYFAGSESEFLHHTPFPRKAGSAEIPEVMHVRRPSSTSNPSSVSGIAAAALAGQILKASSRKSKAGSTSEKTLPPGKPGRKHPNDPQ